MRNNGTVEKSKYKRRNLREKAAVNAVKYIAFQIIDDIIKIANDS